MAIRFGDCVIDPDTRELSRRGKPVHLPPKTFRLLETLLERRPKAISKEELMESLWPGTFVAEGNLARLVAELRDAIGDQADDSRFIRTIHGFGYAFHGEASAATRGPRAGGPVFKLIWGDREIALVEGENLLGRDPKSIACIDVASVSRHHAKIVVRGEKVTIEDLGSKNGTQVRGERVSGSVELEDGDVIRIGAVVLSFRMPTRPGSTVSLV